MLSLIGLFRLSNSPITVSYKQSLSTNEYLLNDYLRFKCFDIWIYAIRFREEIVMIACSYD